MAIPFSYSLRNLWTRRLTTVLTASGMALVVYVFAATLMLVEGLRETLVATGSFDNVVVLRKAAVSEVQSGVGREQAAVVESVPGAVLGADGRPLLAKELVVLVNLSRRGSGKPANVVIRGIGAASAALRPQVHLAAGRMPRPGMAEVAAGRSIAERFQGAGLGETLHFAGRQWQVVGVLEAGRTGFSSEIWGDVDLLMQAFRRPVYSSVIFRLQDPATFAAVRERIETDPRLTVEAKRETRYYADQSEAMARFLRILGLTLTVIFSIGAVIGAMITMYAAVANRTAEIGTLRALGFRRSSILAAFLVESILLALAGGAVGLFLASFLQAFTVTTMNWQSFSQLAFGFHLTPRIVLATILFSLAMGFVGGFLPSVRASRLEIVDSLRAA